MGSYATINRLMADESFLRGSWVTDSSRVDEFMPFLVGASSAVV